MTAAVSAVAPEPMLVGAGWEEQSGPFVVEAVFAAPAAAAVAASGAGAELTQASAVPLRLLLRYKDRRSACELTGFLSEGCALCDGGEPTRVLYGVWGTVPSERKHLFLLQRVTAVL